MVKSVLKKYFVNNGYIHLFLIFKVTLQFILENNHNLDDFRINWMIQSVLKKIFQGQNDSIVLEFQNDTAFTLPLKII